MTEDDSSPAEEAGEFEKAFAAAVEAKTTEPDDQKPAPQPADDGQGADDSQKQPEKPRAKSWRDAPEEWRMTFEEALAHRERSDAGRIAALQRQVAELKAGTPAPAAGDKPKEGEEQREKRTERLKQVREEYPDLAEPFIDELADLREEVKRLSDNTSAIKAMGDEQQRETLDANNGALLQKHPDFYETLEKEGPRFSEWLQTEAPAKFGAIVEANKTGIYDPVGAASVFEAFKAFIGSPNPSKDPSADRRQRQMRAASTPGTGGGARPGNLHPETGDFDAHFTRFAAAKDKELRAAL